MGKLTKNEMIKNIAGHHGLSQDAVRTPVDDFLASIEQAIANGDEVNLHGFGTFKPKHTKARKGRNPRTGEELQIAASNSVSFKPAKAFKDAVNK